MSNPRWAFRVLVAPLALLAGAASGQSPASVEPALPQRPAQEIRAQLSPRNFTTLASEVGAKVDRLAAREGERFTKGQILITFDCSVQRAQVDQARASLSAAEKTLAVNNRLVALQATGQLEADLSAAKADEERAKLAAGMAVLAKCAVPAPFGGLVVEQKVQPQQYVQAGQALLDILDDSVLEMDFVVPSKWLIWLKPGLTFQVAIDETAKSYPVKLARLAARIDPVSQSVKVTAEIGGHFPELRAGMSGRVLLAPPL